MIIKLYHSKDLYSNPKLCKKLQSLTLSDYNSWMKKALKLEINGFAAIAMDHKKIIGWAFCSDNSKNNVLRIGVYVKKNQRRKKIGTKLVRALNLLSYLKNKTIISCPWDNISWNFYDSLDIPKTSWTLFKIKQGEGNYEKNINN